MKSLQKLRECSGHFEKEPGSSQTHTNTIGGKQRSSVFLSLRDQHTPCLSVSSHPGAHNHVGLAATGAAADLWAPKDEALV